MYLRLLCRRYLFQVGAAIYLQELMGHGIFLKEGQPVLLDEEDALQIP